MSDHASGPQMVGEQPEVDSVAPVPKVATPSDDPSEAIGAGAEAGMASRVKRGVAWFLSNLLLSRGLSFIAFLVLGLILNKDEVGVWATAFALSVFAQIFKDGGVVYLIPQRGEREYERIIGPVYWMAMAFNLGVAGVLLAMAFPAAAYFGNPMYVPVLAGIAIAVPLATPATVFTATLQMRLRFATVSRISIASSVLRNVTLVAGAAAGLGPLCFVVPMIVGAVFESIAGYVATRESPWRRGPAFSRWPELFGASKWLIVTVLAYAGFNQGGYLALGLIAHEEEVGVFFVAYQLVLQVDTMLNFGVGFVLMGAFARINDDPARQQAAAMRSARALAIVAAPATIGLAVVFQPFERMVWGGKWADAAPAAMFIALFCTWRIVFAIPATAAQARGQWRFYALTTLAGGLGIMLAMLAGALVSPTATSAGVAMGLSMLVVIGGLYVLGMSRLNITASRSIGAVLPPWLVGVAAAACVLGAARLAAPWLQGMETTVHRLAARAAAWAGAGPELAGRAGVSAAAGSMLLLLGVAFGKLYLVGLRVLTPDAVRDALALAPARLRPHAERFLMMRAT
ncbi:MAG: oligosaccharide flippase family protein [Phycisphaeraceae bacterium]|nr:oligosaccharide flippase family protein [Phycisphaeraceae bacterium]